MQTAAPDYYRYWRIQLAPGQKWTAMIIAPDGSARIRIERESETEVFAAAMMVIDRQLIDRNVPALPAREEEKVA